MSFLLFAPVSQAGTVDYATGTQLSLERFCSLASTAFKGFQAWIVPCESLKLFSVMFFPTTCVGAPFQLTCSSMIPRAGKHGRLSDLVIEDAESDVQHSRHV